MKVVRQKKIVNERSRRNEDERGENIFVKYEIEDQKKQRLRWRGRMKDEVVKKCGLRSNGIDIRSVKVDY